ncbi:site-specific integrase [Paenibacillus sp. FSL H8-0548]|uniref:tyrosine-type recombinase/integrase n=1 Tax=Paenibacillus sp. FSL H8-0548 TaxID=1920422 RepID=UPI0021164821|nr:site-specific integrase [Paenibacillus sp. FSL H8-0548]
MRKRGQNSWTFTVDVGTDAQGKKEREFKTLKVTDPTLLRAPKRLQEYLETELTKFKLEALAGQHKKHGKMLFSKFLEEYWEVNFVNIDLEEKTQASYLFHRKKRIEPYFGHMYMDQIETTHILKFMQLLRHPNARADGTGPLKSATLVYNYRVLKSIFSKAMEWKIIKENPMTGIKKPKEDDVKQMEVYDEKEIKLLFEALDYESLQLRTAITLAITTGIRRGEMAALEWTKIDFERGHLYITQSIPKMKDGQPILKPPKNGKPRRIVLSETELAELRLLKAERDAELTDLPDQWGDGKYSFVFCHPDGMPYDPQWFTKKWIDFHRRHQLKAIRFHDLRHTSISWMIYKQVHSEVIAKRAGHSNIKMLEIYGHIFESVEQAAASVFNDIKKG